MNWNDRIERLGERHRPHYGQLTLSLAILWSFALCGYVLTHLPALPAHFERIRPVSVFSFLPDALLLNRALIVGCGLLYLVCAGLWLLKAAVPWSSSLAAIAFTAMVAMRMETSDGVTHVFHMTNNVLIVHALWYFFYRLEIRQALAEGRFWSTRLYPRWVYSLSLFYICLFYGMSGWNKLFTSGLGWPNGVSLQLWTRLWGDPHSMWTGLILAYRPFACLFQWSSLIAECGALPALFIRPLRIPIGLALLGFHYGQISVFGWGFHGNALFIGLVLLPVFDWFDRGFAASEDGRPSSELFRRPDTLAGRLQRRLLSRFRSTEQV